MVLQHILSLSCLLEWENYKKYVNLQQSGHKIKTRTTRNGILITPTNVVGISTLDIHPLLLMDLVQLMKDTMFLQSSEIGT